jgi:hypothetical protein
LYKYNFAKNYFSSSKEYPPNARYSQGISGFMNLTFFGLPAMVGKNHFLGADPSWAQKVDIFDESGIYPQTANQWDDS